MPMTINELLDTIQGADQTRNLALLLGPRAGIGLWHGDVLDEFKLKLGALDLTGAAWSAKSPDERSKILADCFQLAVTQAGTEALSLLAKLLGREGAPRIYWPDPHNTLLAAMVDKYELPWCTAVKVTELSEQAIVENLQQHERRIVDLGTAVFPVDFSNDQTPAHRIQELVRRRLVAHSYVLMWGWTGAAPALTELLPTSFSGTVGVIESLDRLNDLGCPYSRVCCLPSGSLREGDQANAVLDVLKKMCPAPIGPVPTPRVGGAPRRGLRPTHLTGSDGRGPSGGGRSDREIIANVAERLCDYINPGLEASAARILGLVVDPGIVRTAVAAALATRLPAAVHLRVDDPADLEAVVAVAASAHGGAPAMTVLDTATALSEADVLAYMAPRGATGDRGPAHSRMVVLMPSAGTTWSGASDAKVESLRQALPRALRDVLNEVLPRGVPDVVRDDVAQWVCSDPGSTPFQIKLQRIASVLNGEHNGKATVGARLAELMGRDYADAPVPDEKAPVRLTKRSPPAIRVTKRAV